MTYEGEVTKKLDFLIRSYQNLIDNQVSEGEIVGPGVKGTWKADTPLNKSYQDMIDALKAAKNIIHKYQQVEQIIQNWNKTGGSTEEWIILDEIEGVLKNGNDY